MQPPQPKTTDNKTESGESREKAVVRVGDQTGVINLLAVEQQIKLFEKEGNCLYLVNAHCRLLKAKFMRLECDQWSQIKQIKEPPLDEQDEWLRNIIGPVNQDNNLSAPLQRQTPDPSTPQKDSEQSPS